MDIDLGDIDEDEVIEVYERLHPDVKKMLMIICNYSKLYLQVYTMMSASSEKMKDKSYSSGWKKKDLVDFAYICKLMVRVLKRQIATFGSRDAEIGRLLGREILEKAMQELDPDVIKIREPGNIASMSVKVQTYAVIPKTDTDDFKKLLRYFKIPEETIQKDCIRIKWDTFIVNVIDPLMVAGLPLPDGIKTRHPIVKGVCYPNKIGKAILNEHASMLNDKDEGEDEGEEENG